MKHLKLGEPIKNIQEMECTSIYAAELQKQARNVIDNHYSIMIIVKHIKKLI
jgi:hypothetical protein